MKNLDSDLSEKQKNERLKIQNAEFKLQLEQAALQADQSQALLRAKMEHMVESKVKEKLQQGRKLLMREILVEIEKF